MLGLTGAASMTLLASAPGFELGLEPTRITLQNIGPRVRALTPAQVAAINSLAAASATTRAAASAPIVLNSDRVSVSLAPSPDLAALAVNANATLWAQPTANRRLYLVLGGIEVNGATPSTYNVYLNVPEGAAPSGTEGPGHVGTFSLFGAAGHQHVQRNRTNSGLANRRCAESHLCPARPRRGQRTSCHRTRAAGGVLREGV